MFGSSIKHVLSSGLTRNAPKTLKPSPSCSLVTKNEEIMHFNRNKGEDNHMIEIEIKECISKRNDPAILSIKG